MVRDVLALECGVVAVVGDHLAAAEDFDPVLAGFLERLSFVEVRVEVGSIGQHPQDLVAQPAETGIGLAPGCQRLLPDLADHEVEAGDVDGDRGQGDAVVQGDR